MCHRTQLLKLLLCALGLGIMISAIIGSWFIRLVIGCTLLIIGLISCNH